MINGDGVAMHPTLQRTLRLSRALTRFFGGDAAAGVFLIAVAALAMILANSPLAGAYHDILHDPLPWTPIAKLDNLHLWINDGLMAVFFFVVGLEIKREIVDGDLSTPERRRLPVIAAVAGMAAPAAIYLAIAGEDPTFHRGWAIPAATDIAFAMGVIGLLGTRVPPSLRLFLLTVAIVDDIGAVAIIAVVYTEKVVFAWLIAAMGCFAVMRILARMRVGRASPYVLFAILMWFCVLHSGVHATVAGVFAASAIPMGLDERHDSLLLRLEHALVPWNAYFIVPLFGLANAGVSLAAGGDAGLMAPVTLGVAAGLFFGKQAGILGAILAADKLGFAKRPAGAGPLHLWGVATLCGIGFTMSLFIGALAFPRHPDLIEQAKLGVLAGSLASALLGYAVLRFAPARA